MAYFPKISTKKKTMVRGQREESGPDFTPAKDELVTERAHAVTGDRSSDKPRKPAIARAKKKTKYDTSLMYQPPGSDFPYAINVRKTITGKTLFEYEGFESPDISVVQSYIDDIAKK